MTVLAFLSMALFFWLITASSCSNTRGTKRRNRARPPRLMPDGPAFGVKPCMGPRLGLEREHHGARPPALRLATPCAASRRGRSGVLVQPFDDTTLKRSGTAANSRNFLMEVVVRDWIERSLRRSYCPVQGADQPIKKAYVRRNEFVEEMTLR